MDEMPSVICAADIKPVDMAPEELDAHRRILRVARLYRQCREWEWSNLDMWLGKATQCCAMCGGKEPDKLVMDHCHLTGLCRAWLCRRCNKVESEHTPWLNAYRAMPPLRIAFRHRWREDNLDLSYREWQRRR